MEINCIMIIAQVIGLAAMIMNILSLQCRSNQNFFRCQTAGGILFTVSFIMLGAWSGAMMNVYGILRPELLRRTSRKRSVFRSQQEFSGIFENF